LSVGVKYSMYDLVSEVFVSHNAELWVIKCNRYQRYLIRISCLSVGWNPLLDQPLRYIGLQRNFYMNLTSFFQVSDLYFMIYTDLIHIIASSTVTDDLTI